MTVPTQRYLVAWAIPPAQGYDIAGADAGNGVAHRNGLVGDRRAPEWILDDVGHKSSHWWRDRVSDQHVRAIKEKYIRGCRRQKPVRSESGRVDDVGCLEIGNVSPAHGWCALP